MKRLAALLLGLACLLPALAQARVPVPGPLAELGPWRLQGAGEMRWLGWRIYEAALWRDAAGNSRAVLVIRYDTAIARSRLVASTLEEMQRLGVDQPERWREDLERAFPDVEKGDVLAAERGPDGVRFFDRTQRRHVVDDPRFAEAFFAIWLDPRTREPELRAELLGEAAP